MKSVRAIISNEKKVRELFLATIPNAMRLVLNPEVRKVAPGSSPEFYVGSYSTCYEFKMTMGSLTDKSYHVSKMEKFDIHIDLDHETLLKLLGWIAEYLTRTLIKGYFDKEGSVKVQTLLEEN